MRRILSLALICLALTACQKDVEPLAPGLSTGNGGGTVTTPNPPAQTTTGTITATIDGKVTTFNTAAQAVRTNIPGMSSYSILGFTGTGGASDQISVTVSSTTGAVVTGTYLYDDITSTAIGGIGFVKYGDPSPFSSFLSTTNPTKVVVTSVSANAISGTFTGDVFQFNLTTGLIGAKKLVTQGSFSVKVP
jgi:hypothetical protein